MQIATPLGRRLIPSFGGVIAAVVAAALFAGAGFFVYQRLNPPAAPVVQQTATVTRGNIQATVSSTGTVDPLTASRLTFRSAGHIAEVDVSVGDHVSAGQVLAKLDTTDFQAALAQAQSNLSAAQAKLQQELAGARPEDVQNAQAALDAAMAKLQGMQVSRPEQIQASQATLQAAQQKLAEMLGGNRPETVQNAQAQYDSALAALQNVQSEPKPADLAAAQSQVDNAQSTLQSAQAKLADLTPTSATLATAQSQVDQAKASLESAQVKLNELLNPTSASVTSAQV